MTSNSSQPVLGLRPITDVARELGLASEHVELYGRGKAKIDLAALQAPASGAGRIILVSAITPTPAGEGKTTTSIGLAMALRRMGKNVALCLREPSLGPLFGVKGGGTGGGRATLWPAEDINLHFTGDIHAITSAHNLLAAMIDNACYFRLSPGDRGEIDPRQVSWGRALDMNDRALRNIVVGLGRKLDGVPRQDRFDITAASEVMAILALAQGVEDLEARLGRIVVGASVTNTPITASDVGAVGAMTVLLRDALKPNLVQTAEGGPALVHTGPFANIAHGCSSVLATRLGKNRADYVVTEAGFGFDLGGEKFLDIKCRAMGIWPRVVVLVVTLRALKMHGGAPVKKAAEPNPDALERGLMHLEKHLETVRWFGLPAIVALNVFPTDSAAEIELLASGAKRLGVRFARSDAFARAGEGALDLAAAVAAAADETDGSPPAPRYLYEPGEPMAEKIRKIATIAYGAKGIVLAGPAERDIARIQELGYAKLPICVAKTQLSLTDDPTVLGLPAGFTVTIRGVRLSAGAGFAVALAGEIMTMPGLPREPAALHVKVLQDGRIRGLIQES